MTEDSILKMEQDAERLVEELANLKREVGSYRGASAELEKIRGVLGGFIEATQELAAETYKLVESTKSIGGAQIQEEIRTLRHCVEEKEKQLKRARMLEFGLLFLILALQVLLLAGVKSGS